MYFEMLIVCNCSWRAVRTKTFNKIRFREKKPETRAMVWRGFPAIARLAFYAASIAIRFGEGNSFRLIVTFRTPFLKTALIFS